MRIISFAWTTPALLAGRKTVTRRDWTDGYARRFERGELVQAYNRSPRNGGRRVAVIRLTEDPYQELTTHVPDHDWEAEGFAYLTEVGFTKNGLTPKQIWNHWKTQLARLWVVRFEVVEVTQHEPVPEPADSNQLNLFAKGEPC